MKTQRKNPVIGNYLITVLLFISVALSLRADTPGLSYSVDWPAIHLTGTFTLDVDTGFGTFSSTSASGTYGGLGGGYNTVWTLVQFNSQANYSELDFVWNQGFTGYGVSPSYVGRSSNWTSAAEAWDDLIAKGASDGVYISVVPEPSGAALLSCAAAAVLWRRRRREGFKRQRANLSR